MQPVFAPRTTRARVSPSLSGLLALLLIPAAIVLAFFYAPLNVNPLGGGEFQDDFPQKIFYLHVPIAFAAYLAFFAGAWNALLYLLRGEDDYDVRSYVGVHVGVVFGTLVLLTGMIWAKGAWGVWWEWKDTQLLVFLTLYLFYCSYFMLRFSIDPGPYRARVSAVFTLLGIVLAPLSFLAIRIADSIIHPTVIEPGNTSTMTGEMWLTLGVAIAGFLSLAVWMIQAEVAGKLLAQRGWVSNEGARPVELGTGKEAHARVAHGS